MKQSEFLSLVQEELDTIKQKAYPAEIDNLDLSTFDYLYPQSCIYGQLTGDCGSARAYKIFPKKFANVQKDELAYNDFHPFEEQSFKKGEWYTPLEKYLFMVGADQHEQIIKYLKKEILTIKL